MKILLAVDGSEASERAAKAVRSRPWPPGSKVRVLTVVRDVLSFVPASGWGMPGVPVLTEPELSTGQSYEQVRRWLREQGDATVERVARALIEQGLDVETVVRNGDAASTIIDEAAEWGADLIVIGSRGLSTIKRWLLGSTASAIVHHAPCSVEIVRPGPSERG